MTWTALPRAATSARLRQERARGPEVALVLCRRGERELDVHVVVRSNHGSKMRPTCCARAASERGFAARDGVTVALDLAPDEALQREATARELARAVQELRKQSRLRYGDTVHLAVVGESRELAAVLDEYGGWLADQCRAVSLTRAPLVETVGTSSVELAGTSVELALARSS
jgi:superfamily II RNA helicase